MRREKITWRLSLFSKKMGMVRPVDIARHMGFTKPSITHAITTLQIGGFVERDEDGFICLTDVGPRGGRAHL